VRAYSGCCTLALLSSAARTSSLAGTVPEPMTVPAPGRSGISTSPLAGLGVDVGRLRRPPDRHREDRHQRDQDHRHDRDARRRRHLVDEGSTEAGRPYIGVL
jgi:hypothetical protein